MEDLAIYKVWNELLLAAAGDNIGLDSVENRTKRRGQRRHVKYVNQSKYAIASSNQDLTNE